MRKSLTTSMIVVFSIPALVAAGQGAAPPPPEVSVITVATETVPVTLEYVGVTEASKVVEIRARVQGFLQSRDFEEGTHVKEGALLFTIDPRTFEADVEVAKAQVAQAETRVRLAKQEVKRLQSVTVPGAIAASDLDKQTAELANAEAALRLAQAQLEKAQLELSYTTVTAPLDGYIGKTLKEIGSLVDAGQNSLLTTMSQVDPMYVRFDISEREYLAWRDAVGRGELVAANGDTPYVEIELLDGTVYPHRGEISFEDVAVDLQTGSVEMRATIANPDFRLKPGQFVSCRMVGWERPDALSVPKRAVTQSPQGPFVYVVDANNVAQMRPIQPGPWSGDAWLIEAGVSPGDRVVVEGLMKVRPGAPVTPVPHVTDDTVAREPIAETPQDMAAVDGA